MKHTHPPEAQSKFSGSLRHYHRAGAQNKRSWDDWVDGASSAKPKRARNWLKILAILVAVAALGGILVGLFIELG